MVIFGYISRNRDDVPLSMMMTTSSNYAANGGGGGGSDEVAAIRLTGAITIIITRNKARQAKKGLYVVMMCYAALL